MPIICDPTQTFKVVLAADENKDPQPAFLCRTLTMRQWREAAKLHDAAYRADTKDPDVVADAVLAALRPLIVGWENVSDPDKKEIPFAFEKIEDVLIIDEAFELLSKAWKGQKPTVDEQKKSDSPSGTNTAGPAATAPE